MARFLAAEYGQNVDISMIVRRWAENSAQKVGTVCIPKTVLLSPKTGLMTRVLGTPLRPKSMSSAASQHNHQPSPASLARSRQPRCGAWRTWRPGADASAKPSCAQCCVLSEVGGGDDEKTHSTRTRKRWRGAQPLNMHRAAISCTDTRHGWRGAEAIAVA